MLRQDAIIQLIRSLHPTVISFFNRNTITLVQLDNLINTIKSTIANFFNDERVAFIEPKFNNKKPNLKHAKTETLNLSQPTYSATLYGFHLGGTTFF